MQEGKLDLRFSCVNGSYGSDLITLALLSIPACKSKDLRLKYIFILFFLLFLVKIVTWDKVYPGSVQETDIAFIS